jgi:hypothetical protein
MRTLILSNGLAPFLVVATFLLMNPLEAVCLALAMCVLITSVQTIFKVLIPERVAQMSLSLGASVFGLMSYHMLTHERAYATSVIFAAIAIACVWLQSVHVQKIDGTYLTWVNVLVSIPVVGFIAGWIGIRLGRIPKEPEPQE